jgi:ribosomal protein S11
MKSDDHYERMEADEMNADRHAEEIAERDGTIAELRAEVAGMRVVIGRLTTALEDQRDSASRALRHAGTALGRIADGMPVDSERQ